jgi:hypothetical protein
MRTAAEQICHRSNAPAGTRHRGRWFGVAPSGGRVLVASALIDVPIAPKQSAMNILMQLSIPGKMQVYLG